MSHKALLEALEIAGSQAKLAEAVGTSQQRISYLVRNGKSLPAECVLNAERELKIPRAVLRPDLYPMEQAA